MKRQRRTFSADFKLEAANLVLQREHETVEKVCDVIDIATSSYYELRYRGRVIDVERTLLRIQVNELFTLSRRSAGSMTMVEMTASQGGLCWPFQGTQINERAWVNE